MFNFGSLSHPHGLEEAPVVQRLGPGHLGEVDLIICFSISTSLEHPTVSTLLEHPKYGCSHEVLFLAFLALKMAFKVNFDPTIGFLVSNMSSMPSFRSFGGLIWPFFEL